MPDIVDNVEPIDIKNVLTKRIKNLERRNTSSIENLLNIFLENVQQFHLPGLPSLEELSNASQNVTLKVQRELEKNLMSGLPSSIQQISEMSKNMTDDIQNNVKQLENGFVQLSKNLTNEFETSIKNFHLPNFKELTQLSQNVSKDLQSNLNELSMFSTNASSNIHNIARNVSFDVETRLREVVELPQVITLAKISKNFTSTLGHFLMANADKLSQYSKNVTESIILPTFENWSIMSQNFTSELGENIKNIELPDVNEVVKSVQNFTAIFNSSPKLSDNVIKRNITNIEDLQNSNQDIKTPMQVMRETINSIMNPITSIKALVETFKIQTQNPTERVEESTASDNTIDISSNLVNNESFELPSPTATIVSLLKTTKTLIRNIAKNQDKFAIAFKAIPTLMPYILEANTPSLNTFLKEGTQFSIKDLSSIHSALINFHNFVSDTQNSMDKNKAPSFHKLADLIKARNLGLLQTILQLMLRADGRGGEGKAGIVELNRKDILKIEKNLISPKEFYQTLFESKNYTESSHDRQFEYNMV